jgi:hypothetical protein
VIQDTIIQKNALDMPVLRIQIRILLKLGPDLDPHQSEKQDPDPDLHQSQKQDPAPDPGPQQNQNSGAVEEQNDAMEGFSCSQWNLNGGVEAQKGALEGLSATGRRLTTL